MGDSVWIVLIIAITVITVLFIFRKKLSEFFFRVDHQGVEAHLKAKPTRLLDRNNESPSSKRTSVFGNLQIGKRNNITVTQQETDIKNNLQAGESQTIKVEQGHQSKRG